MARHFGGGESTWARLLFVGFLVATGIALGAPAPVGAVRDCNTGLGGTPLTGVINEGLVVPQGAICSIQNAVVRGAISVEPGAYLYVASSEVRGAVTAVASGDVYIQGGSVRGDVRVSGTAGIAGAVIVGVEVRGDIAITDNDSIGINLLSNAVRDDVIVSGNVFGGNVYLIRSNTIEGDLECIGNTPAPVNDVGSGPQPNAVGGERIDQCAGL